jgi:hypothetical protein
MYFQMQGQTVKSGSKVVIHWNKSFQKGMAYVCLGRSERLEDIFIVGQFNAANIKCEPLAKLASDDLSRRAINKPHNLPSWYKCQDGQLKVTLLNIRSLQAHIDDIKQDFVIMQSDVICLTETWMKPGEQPPELDLPGYRFYQSAVGRGRGVALYHKETLEFAEICKKSYPALQYLVLQQKDLNIAVFYRSQECSRDVLIQEITEVERFTVGRMLIVGDFNMDITSTPYKASIGKLCNDLKLHQLVNSATHHAGHILDLILSNFDIAEDCVFHHNPYYSDHDALCIIVNI